MTILKYYGASWCGPCRVLKPMIRDFVMENKINHQIIDVDEEPAAAQQAGIRSVPVVIIEKDGVETNRFVGIQPKEVYEQAIK